MNTVIDLPWCLIGDLNELANLAEKKGVQLILSLKFARLNNFTDMINAIPVPCTGYPLTWKRKIHTHLIYERQDGAIVCNDWLAIYPYSILTHGNFLCPGHCPIILSISNPVCQRKGLPFRFQNYWCQYCQLDPLLGSIGTPKFKVRKCFDYLRIKNYRTAYQRMDA